MASAMLLSATPISGLVKPQAIRTRANAQPVLSRRSAKFIVRASQEEPTTRLPSTEEASSLQELSPTTVPEPVVRAAPAGSNPGIAELMAFAGPAPETINGRLAMLGFVAAVGAELSTGQRITAQLHDTPVAIALAFIVFAAASLIPMLRNKKVESAGPFTPKAELWNGRAAMIGFATILVVEGIKGAAFF